MKPDVSSVVEQVSMKKDRSNSQYSTADLKKRNVIAVLESGTQFRSVSCVVVNFSNSRSEGSCRLAVCPSNNPDMRLMSCWCQTEDAYPLSKP